jgi:HAMP domain-containing protein
MKTLFGALVSFAVAGWLSAAEPAKWSEPFEIKAPDGKLYKGCTVRQLTPESVMIAHEDGIAKLMLEKLDAVWQERFGFDAEKARLWKEEQAAEQKRVAEQRKQDAMDKKAEKAADQTDKIASLEKQLKEKNDEIERLKQTVGTLQQQVDAQAAALNGRPVQQNVTVVEKVGVVPYHVPYPVVIQQPVVRPVPYPVPVRPHTHSTTTTVTRPVINTPVRTGVTIPGSRPASVFDRK